MKRCSVVIPSRDRCDRLRNTLGALARQTIQPSQFEVIVSLDGSTDGSEEMLRSLSLPFDLRIRTNVRRNAAAARNAGAELAIGDILVFLDDDIEASEGLLGAHVSSHVDGEESVVIGYSKPVLARDHWFEREVRAWWEDLFLEMDSEGHRFSYTDLLSGNFSIFRDTFERLDGFEEILPCREDYEFGWRLMQAGVRFRFCRQALGYHHDRTDLVAGLNRKRKEGEADALLFSRHPNLTTEEAYAAWTRASNEDRLMQGRALRQRVVEFGLEVVPPLLRLLERIGAHSQWYKLHLWARKHSYVSGFRAGLARLPASARFPQPRRSSKPPKSITLKLECGLPAIVTEVAAERPDIARIECNGFEIGQINARSGFEKLDGHHLPGYFGYFAARWAPRVAAARLLGRLDGARGHNQMLPTKIILRPPPFGPVLVGEVDIEAWKLVPPASEISYPARLLVRRGRTPLGWVWLDEPVSDEDPTTYIKRNIFSQMNSALARHCLALAYEKGEERAPAIGISVVVCTRDRTRMLKRCLSAIEKIDYPNYEVVVVDNAPRTDETKRLVGSLPWVRYAQEGRPGLDRARNLGLSVATGDVIAFTDDDTTPDRFWLWGIASAFAQPEVMGVTGFVAPMALDTPAQRYFEDVYGGMGKGFKPRWIRGSQLSWHHQLWASSFGLGANMAFRRSLFGTIGLFDPKLDVGTATRGGGDIEFLHRVVARGHTLLYEPSAIVWHEHRRHVKDLRQQMEDNSCGYTAYLLTCARSRSVPRLAIVIFARAWIWYLLQKYLWPGRHARGLVRAEISGILQGVVAYVKERRTRPWNDDRGTEQPENT